MEWNLSRKSAAKLLSRSDRWLGDQDDAPRNADKSYPAVELVAWFVAREAAPDDLKEEKLKEEINVLKERNRKLQFENEVTAGNMADVRSMAEMLTGLSVPMRKLGDMLGRKVNISGFLELSELAHASKRWLKNASDGNRFRKWKQSMNKSSCDQKHDSVGSIKEAASPARLTTVATTVKE